MTAEQMQEGACANNAIKALQMLPSYNLPDGSANSQIASLRADYQASQYNRELAPPRFAKADSILRNAYLKANQGVV